ncbi:MAG TPA: pyridoxal 5'-phosphate synthase glutaminase subunit PdxT [Blastocatellia bacterium]|nr:pyridoxal 5'-phosphate synthase glutaminase subunit PdxT [Blastocatellia bacterium]
MKVGVLAIQGDFAAHARVLARSGVEPVEVRRAEQLAMLDGLIIPGGESTTILKVMLEEYLVDPIREFARAGKAVFGTCAGAILLASEVHNPEQQSLGLMDIIVERNSYGRQIDSFIRKVDTSLGDGPMEAVFIRAPRITRIGAGVETLSTINGEPVLVRQNNLLAATFHPELTSDNRVHSLFIEMASLEHEALTV